MSVKIEITLYNNVIYIQYLGAFAEQNVGFELDVMGTVSATWAKWSVLG